MSYISTKHQFHELDSSKLTPDILRELAQAKVKLYTDGNGTIYAVNPTRSQLELLARRELLKGVAVVYDLDEQVYKVIPKPAAILCSLAGTCKILKVFPHATQAWEYLEKLRR